MRHRFQYPVRLLSSPNRSLDKSNSNVPNKTPSRLAASAEQAHEARAWLSFTTNFIKPPMRSMTEACAWELKVSVTSDGRKSRAELTQIADDALRSQPGCETASVPAVRGLPNIREGRNWEIPNVVLGDSLISDVDRAVMSVHRRLGGNFICLGTISALS